MKGIIKRVLVMITIVSLIGLGPISNVSAVTNPYLSGYKWAKTQLNYYIDSTPANANVPASKYVEWRQSIILMIDRWNTYLDLFDANISYTYTSSKSNADVIFQYGNVNGTWAEAKRTASGTTLTKYTVILDDYDFAVEGFNSTQQCKIIVHEIGHTLGLVDISDAVAIREDIYSVMVNDVFYSSRFSETPTYDFDRLNIKEMY